MPRPPKEPPRIPGYEILEPIGSGGQGSVWRARQKSLDRVVAIKVLWAEDASDPFLARRFVEEARISSRLSHPNIIQVIDVGEGDGTFWYAMEYVAGVTALQLFRERGPLPEGEVLEIGWQVAQALQHACDRGLIHGDLKPENILITPEGIAKVVDFGLARLSKRRGWRADRTHEPVQGTEGFVAPEILQNRSTGDARSDLFALGVTLYELLATTLPPGPRHGSLLGPDVRERRPNTTARTADLIMRLLAPDPARRPGSPAKVLEELGRRSSINVPLTVAPVAPVKPAVSRRLKPKGARGEPGATRRTRTRLALAAALVVVAATAAAMFWPDAKPSNGGANAATQPTDGNGARAAPPPEPRAPDAAPRQPESSLPASREADPPPPRPGREGPVVEPGTRAAASRASEPDAPTSKDRLPEVAPDSKPADPSPESRTGPPPPPPVETPETAESKPSPALVTATDDTSRILPPPPGTPGAPWTIVTPAGEACDLAVRAPDGFAGADATASVVPGPRAKGLTARPSPEAGVQAVAFRCERSAPLGPRDFAIVFKRGAATAKVALRIQVARPGLATLAPSPSLRDALAWLARHQAPSGTIEAAAFRTRCAAEPRCDGAGLPNADTGVTALAALAALRAGETSDWVRAALASLVGGQRSDGRFASPDDGPGTYGHMMATEACALGWHLLGDPALAAATQRGLDAVAAARNADQVGGAWRYGIQPGDNDASVTTWALRALLAGRIAGLRADETAIAGGLAWIRRVTETNPNDPGFGRIGYNAPGMLPTRAKDRALPFPPALSESITAGALAVALAAGDRKPADKLAQAGLGIVLPCRPFWDASTPDAARWVRERLNNPNADVGVMSTRDFYYWLNASSLFRAWKLARGRAIPADKAWNLARTLGPAQRAEGCAKGSFDPLDPWSPEAGRAGATAMLALALATEQYPQPLLGEVEP